MHRFSLTLPLTSLLLCTSTLAAADYCVVVKSSAYEDKAWRAVADTLVNKHNGTLLTYDATPTETLPQLKEIRPRYTCFVTPPDQAGREFVQVVHQFTRDLDDDPYTDTLWGILTGFDAANALIIAQHEAHNGERYFCVTNSFKRM